MLTLAPDVSRWHKCEVPTSSHDVQFEGKAENICSH